MQTLSLGYQLRQPPLYEWLLWLSQQALGTGIESHLVIRYSLIALLGIATFGAARAAMKDDRWAAAASLSLVFSYPVTWTFHEWATQTILLCVACMATLHAAIRFLERPGLREATYLGLAVALGAYSKFSYPLFLAGLGLAALSIPETRARLADRWLLVSAAIVAAAIAPFGYWLVQVRGNVVADLSSHLIAGSQSHVARALLGLWRLVESMALFLLPWILFVGLMAPPAFARMPKGAPSAPMAERLALRAIVFAALLAAVGIAATGATNIAERYMHPILIVAPVYVFARVARLAPGEERIRAFLGFAVIMAAVVFIVRFVAATDNPITRDMGRGLLRPYAELARVLKAEGLTEGTVLTPLVRDAGNLRAFLPGLRVIAAESLRVVPPPRRAGDDRACMVIWEEGREREARRMVSIDPGAARRLEIESDPPWPIAGGKGTWFLVSLDPRSAACR